MRDQDRLLALIDRVYACAADFSLWADTLPLIADAFGAEEASLGGGAQGQMPWVAAPRTDPDFLQSYGAYYFDKSPFQRKMWELPAGTLASDQTLFPDGALQRSEFFNDWAKPQGYLTVLGSTILVEDGWRTEMQIPGRAAFSEEDFRLYRALIPHIVRAIRINQQTQRAALDGAAGRQMLDALPDAAMLVDQRAALLFANRRAEEMVADDELRLVGGVLALADVAATERLRAAIAGCAMRPPPAEAELLVGRTGLPALSVRVAPLRDAMPAFCARMPVAIVIIRDPERRARERRARLARRYGLTAAEARFALEIAKGDGKHAAAERCGIAYNTARIHLMRIFDKTGVGRQAELVRLISEEE